MPRVKILLDPGQTTEEAEELLFKALEEKRLNPEESFHDPAMEEVSHKMFDIHDEIFIDMMNEIFDVLESEVS